MRSIRSIMAVLFALGSAGVPAQDTAPRMPPPPTGKPVSDSAFYGPVLHPPSPPAAARSPKQAGAAPMAGSARPQAQEERAGMEPITGQQSTGDPSARPAPEATLPQKQQTPAREQPQTQQERQGRPERQQQTKKDQQARRRPGAVQRIEGTPRIAVPAPAPAPRGPAPVVPAPVGPQSSQVVGCVGSGCTDVGGGTYNAGGAGNATVSSDGRLCTRNGANMQCL